MWGASLGSRPFQAAWPHKTDTQAAVSWSNLFKLLTKIRIVFFTWVYPVLRIVPWFLSVLNYWNCILWLPHEGAVSTPLLQNLFGCQDQWCHTRTKRVWKDGLLTYWDVCGESRVGTKTRPEWLEWRREEEVALVFIVVKDGLGSGFPGAGSVCVIWTCQER